MPSLISQLPNLGDINTSVDNILTSITTLKTLVGSVSTVDMRAISESFSSLPVPTPADWLVPIISGLNELESVSPPKGGEIVELLLKEILEKGDLFGGEIAATLENLTQVIKPLTDFSGQAANLQSLMGPVTGTYNQLKEFSWGNGDVGEITGKLLEFINQISWIVDSPTTSQFKGALEQVHTWLSGDISTLSSSAAAAFGEVAKIFSEPFETVLTQALPKLETAAAGFSSDTLADIFRQLESIYDPLDISLPGSAEDFAFAITAATKVESAILEKRDSLESLFGTLDTSITDMNLMDFRDDLEDALASVFDIIRPDAGSTIVAQVTDSAKRMILKADPLAFKQVFDEHVEKILEVTKIFDTSKLEKPLREACKDVGESLDTAQKKIIEVTVQIQSSLEKAAEVIDRIDLEGAVTAAESSVTTLQESAENVIGGINEALSGIVAFVSSFSANTGAVAASIFEDLRDNLKPVLEKISVLFEPESQLGVLLKEVEEVIDSISSALEGISITPVFDEVNGAIDDQKSKLAEVDVSSLNPMLKGLLSAALKVLKEVDYPDSTPDPVRDVLNASEELLATVKTGISMIKGEVKSYNPMTLAVEPLQGAMDDVEKIVLTLSPKPLFQPIERAYNEVVSKLDLLDASVLFKPVDKAFETLDSLIKSIDPTQLEGLLKEGLDTVAAKIDSLPIKDLLEKLTGFYDNILAGFGDMESFLSGNSSEMTLKIRTLLDSIDPQVFVSAINRFIDTIAARAGAIESGVFTPALQALTAAVSSLQVIFVDPPVVAKLKSWSDDVSNIDHVAVLAAMQSRWSSVRRQMADFNVSAELENEKKDLLTKVDELAPMTLFGGTFSRFASSAQKTAMVADEVDSLFFEMGKSIDNSESLLNIWKVDGQGGNAAEKLIRQFLGDMFLTPALDVIRLIEAQKESWGKLIDSVDSVMGTLQERLFGFVRIPALFKEVADEIAGLTDRIRNFDLSAIITGLKSAHESLKSKVDLIDFTDLKQTLDNLLQGLKSSLTGLFPKAEIDACVVNFQKDVLDVLKEISPAVLIGEPLQDTWDEVLEKLESPDIDKLFESLIGVTGRIKAELNEGFNRTGKTFKELLDAAPV